MRSSEIGSELNFRYQGQFEENEEGYSRGHLFVIFTSIIYNLFVANVSELLLRSHLRQQPYRP